MSLKHDKCGAFDERIAELEKELHKQGNELQKAKLENAKLKMQLTDVVEALKDHRCFYEAYNNYNCPQCEALAKIEGKE